MDCLSSNNTNEAPAGGRLSLSFCVCKSSDDLNVITSSCRRVPCVLSSSSSAASSPPLGLLNSLPLTTMTPRTTVPPSASPPSGNRRSSSPAPASDAPPSSPPSAPEQAQGSPLGSLASLRDFGFPPLGALPPLVCPPAPDLLPAVPCQLYLKEAVRDCKVCCCIHNASFQKCKRCQCIGKTCEKVPLQLRRRAAVFAALAPGERDMEAWDKFNDEIIKVSKVLRQDDKRNELLLRSLNRNVFRLLGVMSAVAGLPIPADEEEEVEVEFYITMTCS